MTESPDPDPLEGQNQDPTDREAALWTASSGSTQAEGPRNPLEDPAGFDPRATEPDNPPVPRPATVQLLLTHRALGHRRVPLREGQRIVVGRRGGSAELQFDWDEHVSRRHAALSFSGGEVWVEDLGSRNGIYLDDERVSGTVRVPPAASLVIGGTRLRWGEGVTDPAPTPAEPRRTPHIVDAVTVARHSIDDPPPYEDEDEPTDAQPAETLPEEPATEPPPAPSPPTAPPRADSPGPAREVVMGRVAHVREAVVADDHYRALDLTPDASPDAIEERLSTLTAYFEEAQAILRGPDAEQTKAAIGLLKRTRDQLTTRRLDYDFAHGHERVEDRLAACGQPNQPDLETLRAAWSRAHPRRVQRAAKLMEQAARARTRGNHDDALKLGLEALRRDPFSRTLRDRVEFWQTLASAGR